ncbi:MAG: hypothetical protein Q7U02_06025 [Desulfosalsimonadaceae bacterium]|nr:hypothetical protein [Desulfosalsimonadaceae bacterium]
MHRHLTLVYEQWARQRIASGKAANLQLHDVPSTEWPMFGSVFYLWATESLQDSWEHDPSIAPQAPKEYARRTIDAALDLILDPVHHTWVKTHWGDNYMHTENVFFRSLIIAGITSHAKLTGRQEHLDLLRDQVESLSRELDASPYGLLNDYPGECYPIDVFAATHLIRKADSLLGTDHSDFVNREMRAFQGSLMDSYGLVPYVTDSNSGEILLPSRGIGNSYACIFAPELFPDMAATWYALYERYFWQKRIGVEGFREFRRDVPNCNWTFDVDSGPVIAGFSPAANAYGMAAAKANGRFDHAYTLTAQVLGACWPLADGTLLGPRILSSMAHAPYLGEANLLFLLTRQSSPGFKIVNGGHLPSFFYLELLFYFGLAARILLGGMMPLRGARHGRMHWPLFQFGIWSILMTTGVVAMATGSPGIGLLTMLAAQLLPRQSGSEVIVQARME